MLKNTNPNINKTASHDWQGIAKISGAEIMPSNECWNSEKLPNNKNV